MSAEPAEPTLTRFVAEAVPTLLPAVAALAVESGTLIVRSAEESMRLSEGDALFVRSGAALRLDGKARGALFHADPSWAERARRALGIKTGDSADWLAINARSPEARETRRLLLSGHVPPSPSAKARLLELAFEATRAPMRAQARGRARRAALVRMLGELEQPIDDALPTLATLSSELRIGVRHAGRLFREETGSSFRIYRNTLRTERAKKLLASSTLPIAEVALASGFGSLGRFYDVFRREVGCTPASFRAAARDA